MKAARELLPLLKNLKSEDVDWDYDPKRGLPFALTHDQQDDDNVAEQDVGEAGEPGEAQQAELENMMAESVRRYDEWKQQQQQQQQQRQHETPHQQASSSFVPMNTPGEGQLNFEDTRERSRAKGAVRRRDLGPAPRAPAELFRSPRTQSVDAKAEEQNTADFEDVDMEEDADEAEAVGAGRFLPNQPREWRVGQRLAWKAGTVVLPLALSRALSRLLRSQPRATLRSDAGLLSEALRARTRAEPAAAEQRDEVPVVRYDRAAVLAYVAHRVPGIFACATRVLDELARRAPNYAPTSLLDFGTGPATALLSATSVFPSLRAAVCVEPSPAMQAVAKQLLAGAPPAEPPLLVNCEVSWHRSLRTVPAEQQFELVTCSYVLSELANDRERGRHTEMLWGRVARGGMLVVVEPGTPVGFRLVRDLRAKLLAAPGEARAHVLSPCPHQATCPMSGTDSWCHFEQRVQRTALQLAAKAGASVNWEDEKFSYVVVRKGSGEDRAPAGWARLVRGPRKRSGHVLLLACTPAAQLEARTVRRADGALYYKQARKSRWGDGFLFKPDAARKRAPKTTPPAQDGAGASLS